MKSELLRVVVTDGVLTPDPAGRLPGRGACVHLDPRCVDLAEKRRAFPRALRLAGPLDVAPVRDHVAQTSSPTRTAPHLIPPESRSTDAHPEPGSDRMSSPTS